MSTQAQRDTERDAVVAAVERVIALRHAEVERGRSVDHTGKRIWVSVGEIDDAANGVYVDVYDARRTPPEMKAPIPGMPPERLVRPRARAAVKFGLLVEQPEPYEGSVAFTTPELWAAAVAEAALSDGERIDRLVAGIRERVEYAVAEHPEEPLLWRTSLRDSDYPDSRLARPGRRVGEPREWGVHHRRPAPRLRGGGRGPGPGPATAPRPGQGRW